MTDTAPERTAATGNGGARLDRVKGGDADRDREAAVFARIEAFRRRRPRLRDQVITLAHGAGGKASAALLDAVFLPAFEAAPQTRRRTPTPPRPPPRRAHPSPTPPCSASRAANVSR